MLELSSVVGIPAQAPLPLYQKNDLPPHRVYHVRVAVCAGALQRLY
jgi:hypothetical protein